MAKTSAKGSAVNRSRIMKLRRSYDWTQTELSSLEETFEARKNKKMDAFLRKANKKLLPAAIQASDKALLAQSQLEEQLQAYDVKQRMAHRKVNHSAVKQIFAAAKAGKDWTPVLTSLKEENAGLAAKRQAYLQKLTEKAAHTAENGSRDSARYDALYPQLQADCDSYRQKLDAKTAAALQKKQAKLTRKQESLLAKLEREKVRIQTADSLPQDTVLEVTGLKMYFGGLKAVNDLSFSVKKGEIFGLIGPNGAGKTTVFNCITQFYKPTGGQLRFRTKDDEIVSLTDYQVHDVVLLGIARTFQNVEVVKEVSVLDNLLIAATRHYTSSLFTQMFHLPRLGREEKAIRAKADRVLKYMDLSAYRDRLAWGLPYGVLKKIEIARALMCDPRLIILDEPAAGLNESETAELARLINRIREDFDCTILLVEHDMSLVMNICDHICAISFGKKLAYGTAQEVQASKEVQEAYLGVGGE